MQLPDVSRPDLVIDDPDEHEQCRLERAVREQEHDAGLGDLVLAGSEEQHHEPELADGAVREEQLEVALTHRTEPADQHRRRADDQHEHLPPAGRGQDRGEPRHEVHTRLDHRRGVQVGADRCRSDHRTRQPTAERSLRRLGERTEQHAHDGRSDGATRRWRVDHLREAIRPGALADDDQAEEQREATATGDEDRLQRRGAGAGVAIVVADQEVAGDRRQLPGDEQRNQVVGPDHTQHGGGEQRHQPGEATLTRLDVREVADGVDAHQETDARDEQRHHQRERVEAEPQVEIEVADPRDRLELGGPCRRMTRRVGVARIAHDDRPLRRRPHHGDQRRDRRDEERAASEPVARQQDCAADQQVDEEQQEHGRRSSSRYDVATRPTEFHLAARSAFGASYRTVTNVVG